MPTTWIIAADSSRARIFEVGKDNEKLREIEDMINPEGRQDERDIQSDADGQNFSGRGMQRNTSQPQQTMLEHDIERFCKDVTRYLDKACYEHRFDALCVIAPPKFLGMMREHLGELARKAVTEEIPKDIAWFEPHEIEKYLRDKLR